MFDQNAGGTLSQLQILGGQYKVSPLNGRVTLTGFGGTPPVLYLVAPNQAFVVGTDANVTSGLLAPETAGTTGVPLNNVAVLGGYVGGSVTPALPAVTNQVDSLFCRREWKHQHFAGHQRAGWSADPSVCGHLPG